MNNLSRVLLCVTTLLWAGSIQASGKHQYGYQNKKTGDRHSSAFSRKRFSDVRAAQMARQHASGKGYSQHMRARGHRRSSLSQSMNRLNPRFADKNRQQGRRNRPGSTNGSFSNPYRTPGELGGSGKQRTVDLFKGTPRNTHSKRPANAGPGWTPDYSPDVNQAKGGVAGIKFPHDGTHTPGTPLAPGGDRVTRTRDTHSGPDGQRSTESTTIQNDAGKKVNTRTEHARYNPSSGVTERATIVSRRRVRGGVTTTNDAHYVEGRDRPIARGRSVRKGRTTELPNPDDASGGNNRYCPPYVCRKTAPKLSKNTTAARVLVRKEQTPRRKRSAPVVSQKELLERRDSEHSNGPGPSQDQFDAPVYE
jgi:hypothetical protein